MLYVIFVYFIVFFIHRISYKIKLNWNYKQTVFVVIVKFCFKVKLLNFVSHFVREWIMIGSSSVLRYVFLNSLHPVFLTVSGLSLCFTIVLSWRLGYKKYFGLFLDSILLPFLRKKSTWKCLRLFITNGNFIVYIYILNQN